MQTSARNQFLGRATVQHMAPINAEVSVDIGAGDRITALVTRNSLDDLGIEEGTEVYALLKASSVIVVPGASSLRLSASNQLRGVIVSCRKGAVSAEVILRLAGGQTVTAVITNESIDRLELKEGDEALAVFKSSSVILGVKA